MSVARRPLEVTERARLGCGCPLGATHRPRPWERIRGQNASSWLPEAPFHPGLTPRHRWPRARACSGGRERPACAGPAGDPRAPGVDAGVVRDPRRDGCGRDGPCAGGSAPLLPGRAARRGETGHVWSGIARCPLSQRRYLKLQTLSPFRTHLFPFL